MAREPAVLVEGLEVALGSFCLSGVGLKVLEAEYLVVLGPTGSGKTVLLETLLGFHRPARGRVLVRGRDVTLLPPEERDLGYVPQDYALFPHLTVAENLAFSLEMRGRPAAGRAARVAELADALGLAHLLDRATAGLSGGERQRVALGRALAPSPAVVLLDEPLAALDEDRRTGLARELRRLQRAVGATFLHVCHDLDEAAEVADRVVLLDRGGVVQEGPLEEVAFRPASEFAARFTGTRNLFAVSPAPGGGAAAVLRDGSRLALGRPFDRPATLAVRPERVRLGQPGEAGLAGLVAARTDRLGRHELAVVAGGETWEAHLPRDGVRAAPAVGEAVVLVVPSGACWLVPRKEADGGR